jgi:6-pyruvoyltetrahydropterin/6-carboxytetrahydropterin synthase
LPGAYAEQKHFILVFPTMSVTVCRKEHFNAAHRLHNPAWSPEQNQQVFGKCNNPSYHGHNY